MKASSYFLVFIIMLMVALISWSLTYSDLDTKLLPLMFCSVTLILASAQLAREVRGKRAGKPAAPLAPGTSRGARSHFVVAGWLLGLFLGVYLLGFLISVPAFVLLYLKLHGRGWRPAVGLGALSLALTYGLFVVALRIHLYDGLLLSWWGVVA